MSYRIVPTGPLTPLAEAARLAQMPELPGTFRDPDLVNLAKLDGSLRIDLRYASNDNFLGLALYESGCALMQRPAAEALLAAHRSLRDRGLGLAVLDAYRPWWVTRLFWDATPESLRTFVANPLTGSRHNRGCAVDLTLFELESGQELPMPSGYDEFTERAYAAYDGGAEDLRRNRAVLIDTMHRFDFQVYQAEWWHFDHRDWPEYGLQNLSFEDACSG